MRRVAIAYARFTSPLSAVWHALVDVELMTTACGFRYVEGTDFEVQPHLGYSHELCGVCEDALAEAVLDTMEYVRGEPGFDDGKRRSTDA